MQQEEASRQPAHPDAALHLAGTLGQHAKRHDESAARHKHPEAAAEPQDSSANGHADWSDRGFLDSAEDVSTSQVQAVTSADRLAKQEVQQATGQPATRHPTAGMAMSKLAAKRGSAMHAESVKQDYIPTRVDIASDHIRRTFLA